MTGINMSKLFDDRVAMSDDYRFDGVKGGDAWLKKIRGYFVSKCPEIKPILEFAEQHGHGQFTNDALVAEASTYRWMTETNVRRLSEVLRGGSQHLPEGTGQGGVRACGDARRL